VVPTSYIDGLAKQHDIDYSLTSGQTITADLKAIAGTMHEVSLQSMAMRVGLTANILLSLLNGGKTPFNSSSTASTVEQARVYIQKHKLYT
jgi:hypothetical protein